MSSFDDLSQISSISNISRISRTSSAPHGATSTCNLSEWRTNFRDPNRSLAIGLNETKKVTERTNILKSLAACEESTSEYAKLQLIYTCLSEASSNKNKVLDKSVSNKLTEAMTIYEVKKYLHLPRDSKELKEELTLLGIIDLPKIEFSYEEQVAIRSSVETKLREKIHNFVSSYESSLGPLKETLKGHESALRLRFSQDSELSSVHWKEKIEEVCTEYERHLQQYKELNSHWEELKYKVSEINFKTSELSLLRAEIAHMKAVITKLTCIMRMYKETNITVKALSILNSTLDDKITQTNEEINEKMLLKTEYENLHSTEFYEILRKYRELCHAIKKKQNLYDKL